jgi:hypothetical protein
MGYPSVDGATCRDIREFTQDLSDRDSYAIPQLVLNESLRRHQPMPTSSSHSELLMEYDRAQDSELKRRGDVVMTN